MKPGIRYEYRSPKYTVGRRRARGDSHLAGDLEREVPHIRWQCDRVFWAPLLVLTKFPASPPCSSTSVSPLHVWCNIVCSCLPCALVFTHTTTIYISLHFNAFRVKLWLERVELPLFSAPVPSYTLVVFSLIVSISLTVVICVRLCTITHE